MRHAHVLEPALLLVLSATVSYDKGVQLKHLLRNLKLMKATASNTSRRTMTQLAQRLHLGRVLESCFGSGVMTAGYKRQSHKTGWTVAQLVSFAEAKSFYN